jgi:hypothetical protein
MCAPILGLGFPSQKFQLEMIFFKFQGMGRFLFFLIVSLDSLTFGHKNIPVTQGS